MLDSDRAVERKLKRVCKDLKVKRDDSGVARVMHTDKKGRPYSAHTSRHLDASVVDKVARHDVTRNPELVRKLDKEFDPANQYPIKERKKPEAKFDSDFEGMCHDAYPRLMLAVDSSGWSRRAEARWPFPQREVQHGRRGKIVVARA